MNAMHEFTFFLLLLHKAIGVGSNFIWRGGGKSMSWMHVKKLRSLIIHTVQSCMLL